MIPEAAEKYIYYKEPGIVLLHGDCKKILPLLKPASIDLVLTDPPYGIGKAHWDNIASYSDFIMDRFRICEPLMKRRATFWFTHMVFDTLADLNTRIKAEMGMLHKQLITFDKGLQSIAGRTSDALRTFPRATEYLQFYAFPEIKNPISYYLQSELTSAGVTNKEIAKLFPSKTGGLTGCVSNWLTGANFPLESQYETIREYLGNEYLKEDYNTFRKKYEAMRYVFNLPMGVTDVWGFDGYKKTVEHVENEARRLLERALKDLREDAQAFGLG